MKRAAIKNKNVSLHTYIHTYIHELRLKCWLKNIFVFIPIVFAGDFTNLSKMLVVCAACASFCLVSSAVYVFNDIFDAEKDAVHPIKRGRPIASGAIPKRRAAVFALLLALSGLAAARAVNIRVAAIVLFYLIINVSYTAVLKHRPIFDCFCIAAGFVLRVYSGSAASGGAVSDWLFLTIVAMSLFMAFGKRRGEMIKTNGGETRGVLERYDLGFLNAMTYTCAGLSVTFYSLWAMSRGLNLLYTVPLVIFIVCKYLLLLHGDNSHGDPTTVIYGNRTLIIACGVYAVITVTLLYAGRIS